MKKMIVFMPKMSMGGMERSLANLLKMSDYVQNYEITLVIGYIAEDTLFRDIPDAIKLKILYKHKLNLLGKILMAIKFAIMEMSIKNDYDISICYSHHHSILSKLARKASENNIVFVHNDLKLARTQEQIEKMQFDKFKKVACVSQAAKKSFCELFPDYNRNDIFVVNNYIDGENIINLSKSDKQDIKNATFINVARHLESAKKITRIIKASEKLKKEGYQFNVMLAGDGPDSAMYRELVKNKNLEDDIIFIGNTENPYKYMVKSDALVLASSFEGYGMVIDEARVLEIPVISTKVADAEIILNEGYGIICENSEQGVYEGMKQFLDNGYRIKKKFDYKAFNQNVTGNLNQLVNF